jgi:hypothetical protein
MGISVRRLFRAADLVPSDALRWGLPPNRRLSEPGVYVVSVADDPDRDLGIPWPGCDRQMIEGWIARQSSKMTLDGEAATPEALCRRLGEFWFETEPVIYIGMTDDQGLHKRVDQLFAHTLGARRPHRGGHWLQALAGRSSLFVFTARASRAKQAKSMLIEAFREGALPPRSNGERLRAELSLPFANLEIPGGRRKQHGLRGQSS